MSNRKILNAAATGGIGYYPVISSSTTDTYYDNVSLLLNGDIEVDSNFANVSLLLDGNTLTDKSNNKLAVTANGNVAVTSVNKKFGTGSYYFDGSGDYLSIAATSVLNIGSDDYTFECWVYPTSSARIILFGFGTGGLSIAINASGNIEVCRAYQAIDHTFTAGIVTGQWQYITVTRQGTSLKAFKNGTLLGTQTNSTTYGNGTTYVGTDVDGTSSPLAGYIDDFRITKGIARYTTNFTPPVKALPTHEILDSSVYRLPVTTVGNTRIDTATKKFGTGAMYFDGSGDYLTLPSTANNSINGTENFTIEAWLYPTAASTYHCIYSENFSVQIYMLSSRAINWYFSTDAASGSYFVNVSSTGTIPLNQWSHIAVTRSGNNFYGFINGVIDGTITATGSVGTSTSKSVGSFNSANSYAFTGFIDDLRITKGIARYTANFTPPTASLPTVPPNIPADPWWGNVSLLLDGNTTDAYDPYWQNVSLMLTGDDFIDWSNQHNVVTNNGTVTLDTTNKKFNASALAFSGTKYLTVPSNSAFEFGTGDFTVECWIRFTTVQDCAFFQTTNDINAANGPFWFGYNGGKLYASRHGSASYALGYTWTPTTGFWYPVAVTRQSGTTNVYLNGSVVATSSTIHNGVSFTQAGAAVGVLTTPAYFQGQIADLRITKGIARTITVPTTALPSYKIQDRTQNNLTLTPYGNVQLSTDVFKNGTGSMYFDGTGDYLSLSSTEIIGNGNYTIEFWLNLANSAGCGMILGTQLCHWSLGYDSNGYYLAYFNMSADYTANQVSSVRGVYGSWTHIAASRVGNTTSVYYNGVYGGGWSETLPGVSGGASQIGHSPRYSGYYLTGYIDDLRITNGYARYTQNFTPPSQSFATQYISTGYDANYADVSLLLNGNGTNGSQVFTDLSSTPKTITAYGTAQISTAVKKYGTGAMYFDGSGDYLTLPASTDWFLGASDFTIEMWVNTPGSYSNFRVVPLGQTDAFNGRWAVRPRGMDGTFGIVFSPDGSTYYNIGSGLTLPSNIWCHIAIVRQSGVFKFYLNGTKGTDYTTGISFSLGSTSYPLYIGRAVWDGNIDWNGYIDDLRITKGIARYTTNFTPPTYQLPTDTTGTVIDPLRSSTSLLLRGNGTNGSTSFTDESPNGLTVTNNGSGSVTVNTTTKKYGTGSMAFSGSGQYLTMPAALSLSGDFTIEFWMNPTSLSGANPMIVGSGATAWGAGACAIAIESSTQTVKFLTNASNGNAIVATPALSTGQWYHIALTRIGSTVRMFLNGVSSSSNTNTETIFSPTNLFIGFNGWDSPTGNQYNGYIDDLRITKGYARYTSNFTPPTYEDPIVAGTVYDYNYPQVSLLLNGDGTNGSTVFKDLSSSPKTVTNTGSVTVNTSAKKFGTGSMFFDGTNYLSSPSNAAFNLSGVSWTVELWCYPTTASLGNRILFTKRVANSGICSYQGYLNTTNSGISFFNGTEYQSTTTLDVNAWNHIAYVCDRTNVKVYKNGVLVLTAATTESTDNTEVLLIGNGLYTAYSLQFPGYIDDFRITKGLARYTQNFTPPTAPLPTSYS